MWFDSWHDLVRVAVVGSAAYVSLIALLRVSGKRTLAKLNAFDFVVTVALGSTLATVLLNSGTSWSEGITALTTLVLLQLAAAFLTARTTWGRELVTAGPSVLLRDGEVDPVALRQQRISLDELRQAVRGTGTGDLSAVAAVVLETDGTISVITRSRAGDLSALGDRG